MRVSKIAKMYLMGLVMCFMLPPENEVRIVTSVAASESTPDVMWYLAKQRVPFEAVACIQAAFV